MRYGRDFHGRYSVYRDYFSSGSIRIPIIYQQPTRLSWNYGSDGFFLAAHDDRVGYRVTILHMGNGWVTSQPCLCAAKFWLPLLPLLYLWLKIVFFLFNLHTSRRRPLKFCLLHRYSPPLFNAICRKIDK